MESREEQYTDKLTKELAQYWEKILDNRTPLEEKESNYQQCITLFELGLDLQEQYEYLMMYLVDSLKEINITTLDFLLNKLPPEKMPEIQQAIRENLIYILANPDFSFIKYTMEKFNIDINKMTFGHKEKKITTAPLSVAITIKNPDLVEYLLKRGAITEISSIMPLYNGFEPIHFAAANGDDKIIQLLINYKANVNLTTKDEDEITAIQIAAQYKYNSTIRRLLDNGANGNYLNTKKISTLALAVHFKNEALVEILLEDKYGIDINTKILRSGITVLDLAIEKEQFQIMLLLLEKNPTITKSTVYKAFFVKNNIYMRKLIEYCDKGTRLNEKKIVYQQIFLLHAENNNPSIFDLLSVDKLSKNEFELIFDEKFFNEILIKELSDIIAKLGKCRNQQLKDHFQQYFNNRRLEQKNKKKIKDSTLEGKSTTLGIYQSLDPYKISSKKYIDQSLIKNGKEKIKEKIKIENKQIQKEIKNLMCINTDKEEETLSSLATNSSKTNTLTWLDGNIDAALHKVYSATTPGNPNAYVCLDSKVFEGTICSPLSEEHFKKKVENDEASIKELKNLSKIMAIYIAKDSQERSIPYIDYYEVGGELIKPNDIERIYFIKINSDPSSTKQGVLYYGFMYSPTGLHTQADTKAAEQSFKSNKTFHLSLPSLKISEQSSANQPDIKRVDLMRKVI